jgi:putative transposase
MPRRTIAGSSVLPFHIFNRCNNKEWFALPLEQVWNLFSEELYKITVLCGVDIHAFVLMANHYHLTLSTPEEPIGKAMAEFGRSITQSFNLISGRSGHLFGGNYKATLIEDPNHFATVQKYVYRNPVRAGLVERVEDYPFSTIHRQLGNGPLGFPMASPMMAPGANAFIPHDTDRLLTWLNQPFKNEEQDAIKKALRRKRFELPRNPTSSRRDLLLEIMAGV